MRLRRPAETLRQDLAVAAEFDGAADIRALQAGDGRIVDEFVPDPIALFRERVDYQTLPPRRGYIQTSADSELPLKTQAQFRNHLRPDWADSIDTGHFPMLEQPERLSAAIRAFVENR